MPFKFLGVEISGRAKITLSFKKEDDKVTFIARLVDKSNGLAVMRTNPRPVPTEGVVDLPWEAVITEEEFVKTFIQMLPVTTEA